MPFEPLEYIPKKPVERNVSQSIWNMKTFVYEKYAKKYNIPVYTLMTGEGLKPPAEEQKQEKKLMDEKLPAATAIHEKEEIPKPFMLRQWESTNGKKKSDKITDEEIDDLLEEIEAGLERFERLEKEAKNKKKKKVKKKKASKKEKKRLSDYTDEELDELLEEIDRKIDECLARDNQNHEDDE